MGEDNRGPGSFGGEPSDDRCEIAVGVNDIRFCGFEQASHFECAQRIVVIRYTQYLDLDSFFAQLSGCFASSGHTPDSYIIFFPVQAQGGIGDDPLGAADFQVFN